MSLTGSRKEGKKWPRYRQRDSAEIPRALEELAEWLCVCPAVITRGTARNGTARHGTARLGPRLQFIKKSAQRGTHGCARIAHPGDRRQTADDLHVSPPIIGNAHRLIGCQDDPL